MSEHSETVTINELEDFLDVNVYDTWDSVYIKINGRLYYATHLEKDREHDLTIHAREIQCE